MIKLFFVSIIGLLFVFAGGCKSETSATVEAPKEYLPLPEGFSIDGMPKEDYINIRENADHIDIIFHHEPVSMSLDGMGEIINDLSLISSSAVDGIPANCTPIATKIYQSRGTDLLESDLYHGDGCFLQIFRKNRKPVYGNLLTADGAKFYGNLLITIEESKEEELQRQMQQAIESQKAEQGQ